MKESLYFYLEPYVYLKNGEEGTLLVNLLDDTALTFEDSKSLEIGHILSTSRWRTVKINADDKHIPIISSSINNFMGDVVSSISQPIQFDTEINNSSGIETYRKSVTYSNYNIGGYISNCTIFADMMNQDSYDYIDYITGINSISTKRFYDNLYRMSETDIILYIQQIIAISPSITFKICGHNISLLDCILREYPTIKINPIASQQTLKNNPELIRYYKQKKLRYILLFDLSRDKYDCSMNNAHCSIYAKISNNTNLNRAMNLSRIGCQIKYCPILTSTNKDFIVSLLSITQEELLSINNKYRVLKINNLINSNFWGNIYLFPKGEVFYSLDSMEKIDINQLYDRYKNDFLHGSFEWIITRNFSKCRKCMFQYFCPSPNYLETHLRTQNLIECLMSNNK